MSFSATTRIQITSPGTAEPATGTVGGLVNHHRRLNPDTYTALEQRMRAEGRLPDGPDVQDSSLAQNLDCLTLADLEFLEAGATITPALP